MGAPTHSQLLEIPAKMHRYGRWGREGVQNQRDFQGEMLASKKGGGRGPPKNAHSSGKTRFAMVFTP